jgi:hypothetical protein
VLFLQQLVLLTFILIYAWPALAVSCSAEVPDSYAGLLAGHYMENAAGFLRSFSVRPEVRPLLYAAKYLVNPEDDESGRRRGAEMPAPGG